MDSWGILKLELLQSIVPNICCSGPVMQWSADATEHAHVQEIKVPAQSTNNQNYYDQIARHLDCSDKCSHFDLAMYLESQREQTPLFDDNFDEQDDGINPIDSAPLPSEQMKLSCSTINYFGLTDVLSHRSVPNAPKPHHTFMTSTTAFHLVMKLNHHMTVDEAAIHFGIPDLRPAIWEFLQCVQDRSDHPVSGIRTLDANPHLPFDQIQIWCKVHVQNFPFHNKDNVDVPQTLRALHSSPNHSHSLYDSVIMSPGSKSNWPHLDLNGITYTYELSCAVLTLMKGHFVVQLQLIFHPLNMDYLVAYVQRFNIVSQQSSIHNVYPGTGMRLLRCTMRSNGT